MSKLEGELFKNRAERLKEEAASFYSTTEPQLSLSCGEGVTC